MYYTWDKLTGNLTSRDINGTSYAYTYDVLDRLTGVERDGEALLSVEYADNGNILSKSDIGRYTYNPADKPHAVQEIDYVEGAVTGDNASTSFGLNGKPDLKRYLHHEGLHVRL